MSRAIAIKSRPSPNLIGELLRNIDGILAKYLRLSSYKRYLATLQNDQDASPKPSRYRANRIQTLLISGDLTPRNLRSIKNPFQVQNIATPSNCPLKFITPGAPGPLISAARPWAVPTVYASP